MKRILFVLIWVANASYCQIYTPSHGSITIDSKGLTGGRNGYIDSTSLVIGQNSFANNLFSYFNLAIGQSSLTKHFSGDYNTAIGYESLTSDTNGFSNLGLGYKTLNKNKTGYYNIAIGDKAMQENIKGSENIAIGSSALFNNIGDANTAIGMFALFGNIWGYDNIAIGPYSLFKNTTGLYNTAIGVSSLFTNDNGEGNTGIGFGAVSSNTTGKYNTGVGVRALEWNQAGGSNTAIGYNAGLGVTSGTKNTFLGMGTYSTMDFDNSTVIGAYAFVNASNKVRIGDANVTVIEGQVAWSYPSDRRLKENIQYTSRLGLNFINKLQTVSYNYIADKTHVRHDGFIAQDVEKVMQELGVDFSGLKKADDGTYSLAYSDFVMPLVNAVKEQQKEIDELKKQVKALIKAQNNKQ